VIDAFAYLLATSLRNRVRRQVAQLRSPRYALALLLAGAYIVLLFLRPSRLASGRSDGFPDAGSIGRAFTLFSTLFLALVTAKWWLFGAARGTLAFSPAELQFLFPAPVRRRDLVLYRVLSTQLQLLASALFVAVLLHRGAPSLAVPLRVVGLWLLFSTTFLHQMGVTLVRTGIAERGTGLRRNAPAILIVGLAIAAIVVSVARAFPPVHAFADLPGAISAIGPALAAPIPSAVLAPFRWVLAPAYAPSAAQWLRALGPAILILAVHYLWVLRADATFEEAAVEASARRAARIAARGTSAARVVPITARRPWAPLADAGQPWMAIVWKNTVALTRGFPMRLVVRTLLGIGIIIVVLRASGVFGSGGPQSAVTPATLAAVIALVVVAYLAILGPLVIRNDLRQDLPYLPILRTFPVSGVTIVFAEVIGPAAAVSAAQIALLVLAYGLTLHAVGIDLPLATRSAALAAGCVACPVLNLAGFTIQNGLALLFPAWSRLGATPGARFELIGQQLLATGAALIALLLVLTPPVAAAAAAGWLLPTPPQVTVAIAALLFGAVASTELWLLFQWLGRVYDRLDVQSVTP